MQKNTKDSNSKKAISKNTNNKEKKDKIAPKKTAPKKSSSTKKTTTKAVSKTQPKSTASQKSKVVSKTSTPKSTSKVAKKTASKTKTVSKSTKKSTSTKKAKVEVLEYYDLPYRYNQTVVKILAQTPNTLFVYWDISDDDRNNYIKEFGENFFNDTVPVLIVHNKTMNYSFEIEINDFANSWYFNINDAKCSYEIELGRRAKHTSINLPNNYMYVTSSNIIETPNDHILFEKKQKVLFFKNVKTNTTVAKDISKFNFMEYGGQIHNIYNIYKEIYKHEELENLENLSSSNF